jgi:hypothetical protein
MRIFHALSETPIGRALLAYFFDLPRWTLANILLALSLAPALLALVQGLSDWIAALSFLAAMVSAGMVNMASRQADGDAPRWRGVFCNSATYLTAFVLWAGGVIALALLFRDPPIVVFVVICAFALAFFMIGAFALFVPSLLNVRGLLVWRNALVLAAVNPVVALGLLALLAVAGWSIWISRGALILAAPAVWVLIGVFTVHDRIVAFQPVSSE